MQSMDLHLTTIQADADLPAHPDVLRLPEIIEKVAEQEKVMGLVVAVQVCRTQESACRDQVLEVIGGWTVITYTEHRL